ncbi:DUF4145 domain-containing protein [Lentibacillus cibarius]|uniref:DUF4145 domain-containing protein n=1 Tax=Lentibacillus cibarius TaxID=2583219 RepID=A0A549YFN2_9BACI|nr:DUF4145 domain-containing protein [Lentibacillus cibarius]TRM10701.1 DUF4145 domain-containing protein [Lentibacillus cibarius]
MRLQEKIYCNTCRTKTNHLTIGDNNTLYRHAVQRKRTNENQFKEMEDIYHITKCDGCDSVKFVQEFHYKKNDEWKSSYHTYPHSAERLFEIQNISFKNLPNNLFILVAEVHAAYWEKLYTLCSIGLRMIVEAICNDKSIEGNRLIDKINNLKEHGIITYVQANILHQIRLMGNKTAHETIVHKEDLLLEGINVINSVLFTIYGLEKTKMYFDD